MVVGSFSTTGLEEVAEASGSGVCWLQLYIFRDRELIRSLVIRAERVSFKAIVVTIDQPLIGPDTHKSVNPRPTYPYRILV